MQSQDLNILIEKRRSIFPKTYTDVQIPDDLILQILKNANQAPNHRKTEPWRFKVLQGDARKGLANFMADWYKENTSEEDFSQRKFEKLQKKPLTAPTVIAICMQRDPAESVPEWEEIAAVAMAVQNMWLTCTANNIGCYWSTPKPALYANEVLNLSEGERCLGLFYMGFHTMPDLPATRGDVEEKVVFMR